jgi:hypothetical protein
MPPRVPELKNTMGSPYKKLMCLHRLTYCNMPHTKGHQISTIWPNAVAKVGQIVLIVLSLANFGHNVALVALIALVVAHVTQLID